MSDTPKMIRETLCVAQTAVGLLPDDYQAGRTRDEHIAQLQRLHDATVDVPESREPERACSTFHPPTASTITTSAAAIHRPLFTSHSLAGHQ